MIKARYEKIKAFTLLELSIVILIIGLLIGAIFAGDELIWNAQVKKQITDFDQYKQAVTVFTEKYGQYPGDFNKATSAFGCTAGSAPVGCNGNGSDTIDNAGWPNHSPAGQGAEVLRAWQHLSLAKILPNQYTGVTVVANTAVIGTNVPASSVEPGGYTLVNQAFAGYGVGGVQLVLGLESTGAETFTNARKPAFMKAIDDKIDDGFPRSGQLVVDQFTCQVLTSGIYYYNVSNKSITCTSAYRVDKH